MEPRGSAAQAVKMTGVGFGVIVFDGESIGGGVGVGVCVCGRAGASSAARSAKTRRHIPDELLWRKRALFTARAARARVPGGAQTPRASARGRENVARR
jgi:hypothetical protein